MSHTSPPTSSLPYREIEHTADWALWVQGRDWANLLQNAALGMASLLVEQPASIPQDTTHTLSLEAYDAESLLVDWLSELAYWAESDQLVFGAVTLHRATPTHLEATLKGGRAPHLKKHIKAVTYHNLEINTMADGHLETTVVFDV